MNLVWYRNDLRVSDQHSLKAACEADGPVVGVYSFDPNFYKDSSFEMDLGQTLPFGKTGKYRAQFIIETITDLRQELNKKGIPLVVAYKKPAEIIAQLVRAHGVKSIYFQKEWTRDESIQEKELHQALQDVQEQPQQFQVFDQFLFHPEDIPYQVYSEIPKVFTAFRKACEKQSSIRALVEVDQYTQEMPEVDQGSIPSLEQLGLVDFKKDERSVFPWKGGSTTAWKRLHDYFWETQQLASYKQTRNGLIGTDYSSKFSAWLALGCISPREIYHQVQKFENEVTKNQDTYWLIFELIWRDFFKYVSLKHGSDLFALGGILDRDYDWQSSLRQLDRWIKGQTHERFVNANMREIAATGFMSNRGRQNVASYWSKQLKQDWRLGAAYFEHILIDYDVHSNYGNWMYNSGVGNDPRDRSFNISSQAKRYDENGAYQRLWLEDELF